MGWPFLLGLAGLALLVLVTVPHVLEKNRTPGGDRSGLPEADVPMARTSPLSADRPAATDRATGGSVASLDFLFAAGPVQDIAGSRFARWRDLTPPPRLAAAIDRLRGGAAANAALARLDDPRLHLGELERIIATDPVLTSNILRLVNSPYYGMRDTVASLAQAIGIMGFMNIKTLLYDDMIEGLAARSGLPTELRAPLREHLALTAVMAKHLAPAFPGLVPGVLHTLGILHDIGKLALHQTMGPAYSPLGLAAVQAFGFDHAQVGALVCAGFDLPESMTVSIALHHAPQFVELEDLDATLPEIRYTLALCLADSLAWSFWGNGPIAPVGADRGGTGRDKRTVRDSYRFLVKETILADRLASPSLHCEVQETLALLRGLQRNS